MRNFIHAALVTPGNEAEVTSLPDLMTCGEVALYADKAFIGPKTRALIAATGLADHSSAAARGLIPCPPKATNATSASV